MVLLLMLVDGEFPSDLTSEKFDSFILNGTWNILYILVVYRDRLGEGSVVGEHNTVYIKLFTLLVILYT